MHPRSIYVEIHGSVTYYFFGKLSQAIENFYYWSYDDSPYKYKKLWKSRSDNSRTEKDIKKHYLKKGVLKKFANFTGKHLCWALFLIELQASGSCSTYNSRVCFINDRNKYINYFPDLNCSFGSWKKFASKVGKS